MSKKKVITVSGDSTKWYDKVIFVVKKDNRMEYEDVDFVLEAENIISNYMLNSSLEVGTSYNKKTKTNKSLDFIDVFLYTSLSICIVLVTILALKAV